MLRHDPFTQLSRHVVDTVFTQVQLSINLPIRQVQPQKIQTQQPHSKRLMMARKDGVGEVIEVVPATPAVVTLPKMLSLIQCSLGQMRRVTMRTSDPFRPAQFSHQFKALLIVDQQSPPSNKSVAASKAAKTFWTATGGEALLQLGAYELCDTAPLDTSWLQRPHQATGTRNYKRLTQITA